MSPAPWGSSRWKALMAWLHGVLAGAAAGDHGIARERVGKGDLPARGHVGAAAHRGGEVFRHILNGGQGYHVGERVGKARDVHLDAVEERIEALIGRVVRRHRGHQLRVDDGEHGEERVIAAEAYLLPCLGVGDDAPLVHLAAGAGGGGYGYNGQGLVRQGQALARAAGDVVPEVAVVRGHGRYGLGGVHDAAAAERDDEVAAVSPREPGRPP